MSDTIPPHLQDLGVFAIKSLDPLKYYRNFTNLNVRPDGRKLSQRRSVSISSSHLNSSSHDQIYGSSSISMGWTKVAATITAEIVTPTNDNPTFGFIDFSVSLSPICSPKYEEKGFSNQSYALVHWLHECIIKNKVIDLKQLCIDEGENVVRLQVHLTVISIDGNLKDALLLSTIAALKNVKLPELSTMSTLSVSKREDRTISLSFQSIPISVNVGMIDDKAIIDLNEEEEGYLSDKGYLVFDEDGNLLSSDFHFGKNGITIHQLKEMIDIARHDATLLRKQINL